MRSGIGCGWVAAVREAFYRTDFDEPGVKSKAARRILAAAKRHGIDVDADDDVARAAKR